MSNMSDIFTLRLSVGYRMTLKQSEESKKEAEKTFNEIITHFFKEIDRLLSEIE